MRVHKRWWALLLLSGMVGLLPVGCGGAEAAPESEGGSGTEGAEISSSEASQEGPDEVTQALVEEALDGLVRESSARAARILVLEAGSGRVLALGSRGGEGAVDLLRPTRPGSAFKPVTIAAALEEGLDPSRRFSCEGELRVGEGTLRDWRVFGPLDVAGILAGSSNTGAAQVAQEVGGEAFRRRVLAFGFGRPVPLAVEGAEASAVPGEEGFEGLAGAELAAGIRARVTPLELAAFYAAIANGGVRVEPSWSGDGAPLRILSEATAARMRSLLEGAVWSEGATGRRAQVEGLRVGGKTGTMELEGARRAVFAGIVPIEEGSPLVIYLDAEVEGHEATGGAVAAPGFAALAQRFQRLQGLRNN